MYIGQTSSLRRRFHLDYRGVTGSHLRPFFDEALKNGCEIWRRCRPLVSSCSLPYRLAIVHYLSSFGCVHRCTEGRWLLIPSRYAHSDIYMERGHSPKALRTGTRALLCVQSTAPKALSQEARLLRQYDYAWNTRQAGCQPRHIDIITQRSCFRTSTHLVSCPALAMKTLKGSKSLI